MRNNEKGRQGGYASTCIGIWKLVKCIPVVREATIS